MKLISESRLGVLCKLWARLTLGAALPLAIGCHTAEGVKQDTKSALDATGKGLQKGAAKIDGSDKKFPIETSRKTPNHQTSGAVCHPMLPYGTLDDWTLGSSG